MLSKPSSKSRRRFRQQLLRALLKWSCSISRTRLDENQNRTTRRSPFRTVTSIGSTMGGIIHCPSCAGRSAVLDPPVGKTASQASILFWPIPDQRADLDKLWAMLLEALHLCKEATLTRNRLATRPRSKRRHGSPLAPLARRKRFYSSLVERSISVLNVRWSRSISILINRRCWLSAT